MAGKTLSFSHPASAFALFWFVSFIVCLVCLILGTTAIRQKPEFSDLPHRDLFGMLVRLGKMEGWPLEMSLSVGGLVGCFVSAALVSVTIRIFGS